MCLRGDSQQSSRALQFQMRTLLVAHAVVAIVLAVWICMGLNAVYILSLSAFFTVLRRCLASYLSRLIENRPPLDQLAEDGGAFQPPDSRYRAAKLPVMEFLRQPLDMSWIWMIWLSWQLLWVQWRADAPTEKNTCFVLAVTPLWCACAFMLVNHYYTLASRNGTIAGAIAAGIVLGLGEWLLLFVLAIILGAHVHLYSGGTF